MEQWRENGSLHTQICPGVAGAAGRDSSRGVEDDKGMH